MKAKSIFSAILGAITLNVPKELTRSLPPIQLISGERYGTPRPGWRAAQSVRRHREIQRRQRRNASRR